MNRVQTISVIVVACAIALYYSIRMLLRPTHKGKVVRNPKGHSESLNHYREQLNGTKEKQEESKGKEDGTKKATN